MITKIKVSKYWESILLISLDTFMLLAVMGITLGVIFIVMNSEIPNKKPDYATDWGKMAEESIDEIRTMSYLKNLVTKEEIPGEERLIIKYHKLNSLFSSNTYDSLWGKYFPQNIYETKIECFVDNKKKYDKKYGSGIRKVSIKVDFKTNNYDQEVCTMIEYNGYEENSVYKLIPDANDVYIYTGNRIKNNMLELLSELNNAK